MKVEQFSDNLKLTTKARKKLKARAQTEYPRQALRRLYPIEIKLWNRQDVSRRMESLSVFLQFVMFENTQTKGNSAPHAKFRAVEDSLQEELRNSVSLRLIYDKQKQEIYCLS